MAEPATKDLHAELFGDEDSDEEYQEQQQQPQQEDAEEGEAPAPVMPAPRHAACCAFEGACTPIRHLSCMQICNVICSTENRMICYTGCGRRRGAGRSA